MKHMRGRTSARGWATTPRLCVAAPSSWAQTPKLESNGASVPVVSFDFVWASNKPPHYAIAVDSTGTAAYRSDENLESTEATGDPYVLKFVVEEPTRSKIFALAKESNYFKGD